MWCRAGAVEREGVRVRGRARRLRRTAAYQSSRTHLSFAGIGRELKDPFQTEALLFQKCNLSMDT